MGSALKTLCGLLNRNGGRVQLGVTDNKRIIGQILLTAYNDEYAIPYIFEVKAFERIQSSTSPMPQERYQRLLLERSHKNRGWEDGVAKEVTVDDLDHDEIMRTIQEGISKGRIPPTKATTDPFEALVRLQLVRNKHFINGAIVLFAKDPTCWLPQGKIRLARFREMISVPLLIIDTLMAMHFIYLKRHWFLCRGIYR